MLGFMNEKKSSWEKIKESGKPVVVYGMGNGADKLIERFEKYSITVADFFASDGFVRGHSYRGYRVKSFSEIQEIYSDFVIVLSFASRREEVLELLGNIDASYTMYVPDMPVADTCEYFDRAFYNAHYSEILDAYSSLSDEDSRHCFASVISYKLTGKMKYLMSAYSEKRELYELINRKKISLAIDAGAYRGDTAEEMKAYIPSLEKIYAIEPDLRNFRKLEAYSKAESDVSVVPINAAAWSENSFGDFNSSGNRNSTISATASFEHKEASVRLLMLDSLSSEQIDYIKYDVEGAEYEALVGSQRIIREHSPALLVSLYHRSRDIFFLINYLRKSYPHYSLYLRRERCLPAWEIDLIMIPKEVDK
jgi:FkbM family methyltransferase